MAAGSLEVMLTTLPKPADVLLKASNAVTVTGNWVPAVAELGTELKTSWVAAPAPTEIEFEVTLRVPSAAVRVLLPTDFRVIENTPVPFVRVALEGRVAVLSDEVMATVPL